MMSPLMWTVILFTVSLPYFVREVNSFSLDISSEDPWLRGLLAGRTDRRPPSDVGEDQVDNHGLEHSSTGIKNNRKPSQTSGTGMGKLVRFHLYTRKHPNGFKLYKGCKKRLHASGFNPKHPTKILIHGFGGSDISLITDVYPAYLEKDDYNVITVDWGNLCEFVVFQYPKAKNNVPKVGEYVGKMIDFLIRVGKAHPFSIHLIGHSLGAHVAGFAGAYLGMFELGRITGLDPAGVFYDAVRENERLNRHDALLVDVIHTNGGELGLENPIGDIDFYPNGGTNQPGCSGILELCNHNRAIDYFINSIRNEHMYTSIKCDSVYDAWSGNCYGGASGTMGENITNMSPGIYYVRT